MRRFVMIGLAALALLAAPVRAADTIRIIVPFAAGGPADMLARLLAQELQGSLGATLVVDNRGGAGGILGTDLAARAAPDGRTLLVATLGSQLISAALQPHPGYDPIKSFEPIALIGSSPALLVVGPSIAANSLKELIEIGKTRKLTYASSGPGTTMHISGELLNAGGGIKATHVPYRGAAPGLVDVIAGHVDIMIADPPVLLPHVANKSVRPLALFGSARTPLLPEIATARELGFPDMIMENWYGVLVPAGVPSELIARLETAVLAALQTPVSKERLATGNLGGTLGREAFKAKLDKDNAYWEPAVKRLGITAE